MMNAQPIGGRPGDKWRDDIWTMKYLSGFKWEMLGEQVGEYALPPPPITFDTSAPTPAMLRSGV